MQCTGRPGSIVHHRARTCYDASECAQHVVDGRSRHDHARSTHAPVKATGRHACQLGWRIFFLFGSADQWFFEDSNGSSADPDRYGFRWIRFTPRKKLLTWSRMFIDILEGIKRAKSGFILQSR